MNSVFRKRVNENTEVRVPLTSEVSDEIMARATDSHQSRIISWNELKPFVRKNPDLILRAALRGHVSNAKAVILS